MEMRVPARDAPPVIEIRRQADQLSGRENGGLDISPLPLKRLSRWPGRWIAIHANGQVLLFEVLLQGLDVFNLCCHFVSRPLGCALSA
jgi:hypothetical protein